MMMMKKKKGGDSGESSEPQIREFSQSRAFNDDSTRLTSCHNN
jgi:hypothetical protein